MPLPDRYPVRNVLLRAMALQDLDPLRPHLETMEVHKGETLVRPGELFKHAWFPENGLASIVSSADESHRVEVGLFGYDGMVSTALVLGADCTPQETFAQVGGTWLRIGAGTLRDAMHRSPALHGVLLRYVQASLLTAGQTVLANGLYKTEERLARWLLMTHDRLDGDVLPLTHEFLSIMLGVHRPGVTMALHVLEGAGMIRAKRGLITVLDRSKLREVAGNSYGPAEVEYERLIGPFRKHGAEPASI